MMDKEKLYTVIFVALSCVCLIEKRVFVGAEAREKMFIKTSPRSTKQLFRDTYEKCNLRSVDPFVYLRIQDLMKYDVKMIEYDFSFANYTVNPLILNNRLIYNAAHWSRVNSYHGEVLLSLSSSYDVMSLTTLTLGVEKIEVALYDAPAGCAANMTEQEKLDALMYLLMRDFQHQEGDMTLKNHQRICHEIIKRDGEYGSFGDRCCHINVTEHFTCTTEIVNPWLRFLLAAITVLKFSVVLFGPLSFVSFVLSLDAHLVPYAVKLKDPLIKTICLCNADTQINKTYHKVLDLRERRGFEKFRASIAELPLGEPVKVKFSRYDILVDYDKLLVENEVPVGLFSSLVDSLLRCQIKDIGPFQSCCETDLFKSISSAPSYITWYRIFAVIGSVLTVFLAPVLYYCRLIVYYLFEESDIERRHSVLEHQGLWRKYDGSLVTTLSPTHALFLFFYAIYYVTAFVLGLISGTKRGDRIKRIIVASFTDLQNFSWLKSLRLLVANVIWPFSRFGLLGIIVAPFYWVVFLPLTVFIYVVYSVPATYVVLRMFHHARYVRNRTLDSCEHSATYRVHSEHEHSIKKFETRRLCHKMGMEGSAASFPSTESTTVRDHHRNTDCRVNQQTVENFIIMAMCVLALYGILLVLSECFGFFVEMFALTVMGIIVNAGSLLRYISLFILLIAYSYTSYSDVGKKYLKTIKCLFSELKKRCKDIENVTSLPSHLQENFGFKSQELSEQADYEMPDDLDIERPAHWLINDLVLFIDNEDMPRLPKRLFQEVCEIRTVGAPGPVYISLLEATQSFLKIVIFVFFVFIVVATFGSVYQVSSTNQMVATMAGGAIPMFMRKFLSSGKPEIEFGAVSFRNKLEEIIMNFQQVWPIYDLPFEKWTSQDEQKLSDEGLKDRTYYRRASINAQTFNLADIQRIRELHGLATSDSLSSEQSLRLSQRSHSEGMLYVPNKPDEVLFASAANKRHFDVDILVYLPGDGVSETAWCDKWSDGEDDVFYRHGADRDTEIDVEGTRAESLSHQHSYHNFPNIPEIKIN